MKAGSPWAWAIVLYGAGLSVVAIVSFLLHSALAIIAHAMAS